MKQSEIQKIYERFYVPLHVRAHMKKVAEVAQTLCQALKENGYEINTDAVVEAALLHDVLRVCDFRSLDTSHFREGITEEKMKRWKEIREIYGHQGHVDAMTEVLEEMGESYLANLVAKHDFFRIDQLKSLEEKILFYSDKRAEGDKLVDLQTRFREGTKRNAIETEDFSRRRDIEGKILALEQEFIGMTGEIPLFQSH